jgi:hypothetical protein
MGFARDVIRVLALHVVMQILKRPLTARADTICDSLLRFGEHAFKSGAALVQAVDFVASLLCVLFRPTPTFLLGLKFFFEFRYLVVCENKRVSVWAVKTLAYILAFLVLKIGKIKRYRAGRATDKFEQRQFL